MSTNSTSGIICKSSDEVKAIDPTLSHYYKEWVFLKDQERKQEWQKTVNAYSKGFKTSAEVIAADPNLSMYYTIYARLRDLEREEEAKKIRQQRERQERICHLHTAKYDWNIEESDTPPQSQEVTTTTAIEAKPLPAKTESLDHLSWYERQIVRAWLRSFGKKSKPKEVGETTIRTDNPPLQETKFVGISEELFVLRQEHQTFLNAANAPLQWTFERRGWWLIFPGCGHGEYKLRLRAFKKQEVSTTSKEWNDKAPRAGKRQRQAQENETRIPHPLTPLEENYKEPVRTVKKKTEDNRKINGLLQNESRSAKQKQRLVVLPYGVEADKLDAPNNTTTKVIRSSIKSGKFDVRLRDEPQHGDMVIFVHTHEEKEEDNTRTFNCFWNKLRLCVEMGCDTYVISPDVDAGEWPKFLTRMGKFKSYQRDSYTLWHFDRPRWTFEELCEWGMIIGKEYRLFDMKEMLDLFFLAEKSTHPIYPNRMKRAVLHEDALDGSVDLMFPFNVEMSDEDGGACPLRLIPLKTIDWYLGDPCFYINKWCPPSARFPRFAHKSSFMLDISIEGKKQPTTNKKDTKAYCNQILLYGEVRERLIQWMRCKENATDVKNRWNHELPFALTTGMIAPPLPSHLCGLPVWLACIDQYGRTKTDKKNSQSPSGLPMTDDPAPESWVFGNSEELDNALDEAESDAGDDTEEWLNLKNSSNNQYVLADEDSLDYVPPTPPVFDASILYTETKEKNKVWFLNQITKNEEAIARLSDNKRVEKILNIYRKEYLLAKTQEEKDDIKTAAEDFKKELPGIIAGLEKGIETCKTRLAFIDEDKDFRASQWRRSAERKAELNAWNTLLVFIDSIERLNKSLMSNEAAADSYDLYRIGTDFGMTSMWKLCDALDSLMVIPFDNPEEKERQLRLRKGLRNALVVLKNRVSTKQKIADTAAHATQEIITLLTNEKKPMKQKAISAASAANKKIETLSKKADRCPHSLLQHAAKVIEKKLAQFDLIDELPAKVQECGKEFINHIRERRTTPKLVVNDREIELLPHSQLSQRKPLALQSGKEWLDKLYIQTKRLLNGAVINTDEDRVEGLKDSAALELADKLLFDLEDENIAETISIISAHSEEARELLARAMTLEPELLTFCPENLEEFANSPKTEDAEVLAEEEEATVSQ